MIHLKRNIIFWTAHACYLISMYHARKFHKWNAWFLCQKKRWDKEF